MTFFWRNMFVVLLFGFNSLLFSVSGHNEFYADHKVYNVKLQTQNQADNFHVLKSDLIDYWRNPSLKHQVVGKAMVPPSHLEWFEGQLEKLGLDRDIAIEDVYEYLNTKQRNTRDTQNGNETETDENDFDFDIYNYNRYDEILDYIKKLKYGYTNSTQIILDVVEDGETDEGRPLVYIKVKAANTSEELPVAVIEAGIIPREWITVPTTLHILSKLLREEHSELIEKFQWIIIPVLNPDGYEYSHTNLRLWTKNRSTRSNLGFVCPGVNINRNFDIAWQISGSSSSPCSHLYSGIDPFSEPESRFLRNILEEFKDRIRLYISLQNSGSDGFISYPWQYERAASGMFRQHHLLGLDMTEAINGTYKLDVGFSALGDRASGTSSDYAMEEGVLYTFNIDIKQRGEDGVNVPEEEILDVVEEVWRAVETAAISIV